MSYELYQCALNWADIGDCIDSALDVWNSLYNSINSLYSNWNSNMSLSDFAWDGCKRIAKFAYDIGAAAEDCFKGVISSTIVKILGKLLLKMGIKFSTPSAWVVYLIWDGPSIVQDSIDAAICYGKGTNAPTNCCDWATWTCSSYDSGNCCAWGGYSGNEICTNGYRCIGMKTVKIAGTIAGNTAMCNGEGEFDEAAANFMEVTDVHGIHEQMQDKHKDDPLFHVKKAEVERILNIECDEAQFKEGVRMAQHFHDTPKTIVNAAASKPVDIQVEVPKKMKVLDYEGKSCRG